MKRKRFSVEQIVAVLKQAELGMAVAEIVRQTGISEQTFYRWKNRLWRTAMAVTVPWASPGIADSARS